MWTRDEMLECCHALSESARRMAATQELMTIAFVFANHHPQTDEPCHEAIMLPMMGMDKDEFARAVQFGVDVTGASGVLMIAEAWMVRADKDQSLDDVYPASGSLADHPDRIEVVTATLSVREGDAVMWNATIEGSVEAPPRTVSEFEEQPVGAEVGGRLASFFAPVEG